MPEFKDLPPAEDRYYVLSRHDQALAIIGPNGYVATIYVDGDARLFIRLPRGAAIITADPGKPTPYRQTEQPND